MNSKEEEWYIGIELGSRFTMASYYRSQMKEPETKSPVAGAQTYRIPTALCKRKGIGQWYFSEEARKLAKTEEGIFIGDLLERARNHETIEAEETYEARELLLVFLRKVIRMVMPAKGAEGVTRCVFSLEKVTGEITELVQWMCGKLGLEEEQIMIQDNQESFYAYAVSQEKELWLYEVVLFYYGEKGLFQYTLLHDKKTSPQVSRVTEQYLGELSQHPAERDQEFAGMVQKALDGKIVSSVYLVGEGFEGDWLKSSLQMICRGRRAFQGKNLYTKGACYAGVMEEHPRERETVYFCSYKTTRNIFLKTERGGREYMYPFVEAGKNLHQMNAVCRILLEGEPVLDIWFQHPGSKEAVIETMELEGLKPAEQKGCRLELCISSLEGQKLFLKVKDIGLGEILPGSGREWEFDLG